MRGVYVKECWLDGKYLCHILGCKDIKSRPWSCLHQQEKFEKLIEEASQPKTPFNDRLTDGDSWTAGSEPTDCDQYNKDLYGEFVDIEDWKAIMNATKDMVLD